VARGAPILNDVTMTELIELGIDKKVDRVLTRVQTQSVYASKKRLLNLWKL